MLKVLTGNFDMSGKHPEWLRRKMGSIFDSWVDDDWLLDPIVQEELRSVDHIVKVDGMLLTKDTGKRIPVHLVSQGSKQFIFATRGLDGKAVDCFHVGSNVYEYFHKWCMDKNVDITLLMQGLGVMRINYQLNGIFLNTGDSFSNNDELLRKLFKYRFSKLENTVDNGIIHAKLCNHKEEFIKNYDIIL